jgi:hypothetical protein
MIAILPLLANAENDWADAVSSGVAWGEGSYGLAGKT